MRERKEQCPKCGAFMRYDAYYARWACGRRFCDGLKEITRSEHDGKPSPQLGRLLADLDDEKRFPMTAPSAEQIRHNLRCEVTQQRCADIAPRVCGIDGASRESLGPDWRCATCAAYALLATLSQSLTEAHGEIARLDAEAQAYAEKIADQQDALASLTEELDRLKRICLGGEEPGVWPCGCRVRLIGSYGTSVLLTDEQNPQCGHHQKLTEEREGLRAQLCTMADAAGERASIAALLADREEATVYLKVEALTAAHERVREALTCNKFGGGHYCPNCDNSIGPEILESALASPEGTPSAQDGR